MADALQELGTVYDTYAPKIFRYIYHRLGDKTVAEDLTSEVFIRFLRSGARPNNLAAFLYRVAHNLTVDHLRRRKTLYPLDDGTCGDGSDPSHQVEIGQERERLRRALARLTPDQQQVIVLKFLEGLPHDEIARIVSKPIGAVKALQHRGLIALRDLLSLEDRAPAAERKVVK